MIARLNASFLDAVTLAGVWFVTLCWYAGSLCLLLARAIGGALSRPVRVQEILQEAWMIGGRSLPIAFLASFFIGMVLALQSAYQMQKLSAEMYIAGLVSLSMIREIGPVMTALIVAGRVGSSIAAELGTMKVTEQIDALKALGVSPVSFLVVPRFIALLIGLPVLTLWADAVGVLGGFLIGTLKLNILPSLYWKMTTLPLVFKDLLSGLLKSVIFAMIICIVSCFEGFRTEGGAEGVGRSTTAAVVSSFVLILSADCLLTAIFYFMWH